MSLWSDGSNKRERIPISEPLARCGITQFLKEGSSILLKHTVIKNGMNFDTIILFKAQRGFFDTIQEFERKAMRRINRPTLEALKVALSADEFYEKVLTSNRKTSFSPTDITSNDLTSGIVDGVSFTVDGNDNSGISRDVITSTRGIYPSKDLLPYIRCYEDCAEYVVKTIKRTVKQEDLLVRLLVYVGLSVYSYNPLCIGLRARTSEGKTYVVIQSILKFFPKQDILVVGSMSPKTLIRQHGNIVNNNNEPLDYRINALRKAIRRAQREKDYEEEIDLDSQLNQLVRDSKYIIDMHGKILLFLEPPKQETWEIIKSMLSHDAWEIEHPYVDTDLKTRRIVTRGWPVCIFCSAKDESKWDIWPEIQSRFLITSPSMTSQKYLDSNRLTAQKLGLPDFVQQNTIVSDFEVDLARKCILNLKSRIHNLCPINYNSNNEFKPIPSVWIPYHEYLANALPHDKGTTMRMAGHVFSLLNVVALAKSQFILDTVIERQVISRPQDLIEVLKVTRDMIDSNYTGIPKDKVGFYNEIFVPYYKSKSGPDLNDNGEAEPFKAVTTKELCDEFKKKKHRGITTSNLKHTYLDELIRNDLIGEEKSKIDGRQNIYYPLLELGLGDNSDDVDVDNIKQIAMTTKVKNLLNISKFNNFLQVPSFEFSYNHNKVPEWWLISQIFTLLKYRIEIPKLQSNVIDLLNTSEEFKLIEMDDFCSSDNNDNAASERRLTLEHFMNKYDNIPEFSIQYIFNGSLSTFNTIRLGNLEKLHYLNTDQCKKLLNLSSFNNFFIMMGAAAQYNSLDPYEVISCLKSSRRFC